MWKIPRSVKNKNYYNFRLAQNVGLYPIKINVESLFTYIIKSCFKCIQIKDLSIILNHVPKRLEASLITSESNPIFSNSSWTVGAWHDGFASVGAAWADDTFTVSVSNNGMFTY